MPHNSRIRGPILIILSL